MTQIVSYWVWGESRPFELEGGLFAVPTHTAQRQICRQE